MEINKLVSFIKKNNLELFDYLNTHNIRYREVMQSCVLDIFESDPHWEPIHTLLQKSKFSCLTSTIYTEEEIALAKWLTMRSVWRCGYPQPEHGDSYEDVTYTTKNQCPECGSGLLQTSDFRMKKTPNWGRRHFMMLNWVEDELFVDDVAKCTLNESGLSGFCFRDVQNKKGTEVLPNVSQLVIPNLLAAGIVTGNRTIDGVDKCSHCKIIKYHHSGAGSYVFREEIFHNAPDIIKTHEIFGWGYLADRLIIVSQDFYQMIKRNKLDRSLEFQPITLV